MAKQKIALLTVVSYSLLMAVGMFVMHHIVGSSYEQNDMPKTILWFEVPMTMLAIGVYLKYFRSSLKRYQPATPNKIILLGFAAMLINMVIMGFLFLTKVNFTGKDMSVFFGILFATMLVGISEELVFRGIVLPAYLENGSKIKAIVVSSFLFAIFHVTNLSGGIEITSLLIQLVNAMLLGTTFAFIAIEIGKVWPLMIFHFLYDFFLISSEFTGVDLGATIIFGGFFGMLFGVVLFSVLLMKEKTHRKRLPVLASWK